MSELDKVKTVAFRIRKDTHEKLVKVAAKKKKRISELLRDIVEKELK